jgi:hypothetical protein
MVKQTVGDAYHHGYCEAVGDLAEGGGDHRRVWESVVAVLTAYTSESNRDPARGPLHDRLQQFPVEVAEHLRRALGEVLAGTKPGPFALKKRGPPKYGPRLMDVINSAVRYANAGEIVGDKSPQRTILAKFNITRRTWMDWRRRADPEASDPRRFWPDEEKPIRAQGIRNALERAVENYRHGGRSDGGASK